MSKDDVSSNKNLIDWRRLVAICFNSLHKLLHRMDRISDQDDIISDSKYIANTEAPSQTNVNMTYGMC